MELVQWVGKYADGTCARLISPPRHRHSGFLVVDSSGRLHCIAVLGMTSP